MTIGVQPDDILAKAESLRNNLEGFRDEMVNPLYSEAERVAKRAGNPLSTENMALTRGSSGLLPRRLQVCRSC